MDDAAFVFTLTCIFNSPKILFCINIQMQDDVKQDIHCQAKQDKSGADAENQK